MNQDEYEILVLLLLHNMNEFNKSQSILSERVKLYMPYAPPVRETKQHMTFKKLHCVYHYY